MNLQLIRKYLKPNYTIGKLYIDGEYFCDTLEDTVRDLDKNGQNEDKIWGQTAIPYGRYQVIISYSPKFKKNMPLLLNVPGYEGVRIHSGNTPDDTLGCILVGQNKRIGQVVNSTAAYNELMKRIDEIADPFEKIYIEII